MRTQVFTLLLMAVLVIFLIRAAKLLHESIETARTTNDDRMRLLNRMEATVDRMEKAAGIVKDNLAESISRADRADDTVPGASADAALRTGEMRPIAETDYEG